MWTMMTMIQVLPTGSTGDYDQYGQMVTESHAANMYAPSMEFIEGTDDDDVFLAFGLSPRDVVAESDYGSSGSTIIKLLHVSS